MFVAMDTPRHLIVTALDAELPGPVTALSSELPAAAGGWQRILPAGQFSARDGRGPFVLGDRANMEAIVAATSAYHGETDIVVDYDHQALAVMEPKSGKTAKAAGWVKGVEVRDDGIWADIEWTAAAAEAIRNKEYRYLSPVVPHDAKGNVKMILGVSLTNVPAFHIEAFSAAHPFSQTDRTKTMDKILAALGLAKDSGEDAALSALNALLTANTALATALGLGKDGLTQEEESRLEEIAALISATERRAIAAERDAMDRYAATYLAAHIGAEFSGYVSGVARFGIFIELDETGGDGLVPARSLGGRPHHDRTRHSLSVGGAHVILGDRVLVRLVEADAITGSTALELLAVNGKTWSPGRLVLKPKHDSKIYPKRNGRYF